MWGSHWRQRIRLGPLYGALRAAAAGQMLSRLRADPSPWQPGVSLIIPERDAPELLAAALDSASAALARLNEPQQIIVVVNGASRARYEDLTTRHPGVEWQWHAEPLGFSAAIAHGVAAARFDGSFLMNNDMTIEPDVLLELTRARGDAVFAIAARIDQRSADGRREETGFVDWYVDGAGINVFHADPGAGGEIRATLCASGGASLFRTSILRRYATESKGYDPFYWEDVEWGVRGWSEGLSSVFVPTALAYHRHRATTARFHPAPELARLIERNRLLFDARNAASGEAPARLMKRICQLAYASQRELASLGVAHAVLRHRFQARRSRPASRPPQLAVPEGGVRDVEAWSFSYRLRRADNPSARPRVLVVTPFAVYPPRHGGARRSAGLLGALKPEFDLILLSDEASLHDARSFAGFDGFHAVMLTQRGAAAKGSAETLAGRMAAHVHPALVAGLKTAIARYRPALVQVEHVELAGLVAHRQGGAAWVLGLHDAYGPDDFDTAAVAAHFQDLVLARFDAVTVCSAEDATLVSHRRLRVVPNGTSVPPEAYRPSEGLQLIFSGPFRYGRNLEAIRGFLLEAYPRILAAVPGCRLQILGGDGAPRAVEADAAFRQPGISVLGHREDAVDLLRASALSVNPLRGIRGSAIKLIESLCAGRICVSTESGARGFADRGLAGLLVVPDVAAMAAPIIALLRDPELRRRREAPDVQALSAYRWERCAEGQAALYRELLG